MGYPGPQPGCPPSPPLSPPPPLQGAKMFKGVSQLGAAPGRPPSWSPLQVPPPPPGALQRGGEHKDPHPPADTPGSGMH